jgi:excisionase family DNA binding protein
MVTSPLVESSAARIESTRLPRRNFWWYVAFESHSSWIKSGVGRAGVSDQYSAAQVAQRLGVTPYTVRKWIREGKLPATKLGYKTVRVSSADLEAFLGARSVQGGGQASEVGRERLPTPR